jgi:hypothetical protein
VSHAITVRDSSTSVAHSLSKLIVLVVFLGVGVLTPSVPFAEANTGGVTITGSRADIEDHTCITFDATAVMKGKPRDIFDAFTRPEHWTQMEDLRQVIESSDHRSKILEFDLVFRHMQPDKVKMYQRQFLFDPQKLTISARMLPPWSQRSEYYALFPFRDGTETMVVYHSRECSPERPGDKTSTKENLEPFLTASLKRDLENVEVESGVKVANSIAASTPAAPLNGEQRASPTAVATPLPPQ